MVQELVEKKAERKGTMRTTTEKTPPSLMEYPDIEQGCMVRIRGLFWKTTGLSVYGEILEVFRKRAKVAIFQPDGHIAIKFYPVSKLLPIAVPPVIPLELLPLPEEG